MADILVSGVIYHGVTKITVPTASGGTAEFVENSGDKKLVTITQDSSSGTLSIS